MGAGVGSVFHAPDQVRAILDAMADKTWYQTSSVSAGTLSQSLGKKPYIEYAGFMLCETGITGVDTDADHNESVTYMEAFAAAPTVFCTEADTGTWQVTVASSRTASGFVYANQNSVNNQSVLWIAQGATLEAL